MDRDEIVKMLEAVGIKPTSNRILVLRSIVASDRPLSLTDLENELLSLEKSSIFRVLTSFLDHGLIHAVEDGRGIVKYELCEGKGRCAIEKMHVHFYCEVCRQTTCLDDIQVPAIPIPEDYEMQSVNYMVKGVCPHCRLSGKRK